jgi:hypothetical protein
MTIKHIDNKYQDLASAKSIGASKAILDYAKGTRDQLRVSNETNPVMSDNIVEDFRFKAGKIAAYNEILGLPDRAIKYLKKLKN